MINFTTCANVANSFLKVLQGYSKTIRLLLVMFLTLTVTTNAWGEEYEKYSGTITEGDYLIVYSNGAMKNTVSSDRLQYSDVTVSNNKISNPDVSLIWHIAPSGNYWTIYNASVNKYAAGTGAKNKAQLLASGTDDKSLWTVSGTSTYEFVNKANKAAGVNSNLRKNGTYGFACYATGTGGALTLYKKVTSAAPSFTVTATSNDNNYGTVSVSGTTITASPKTGYTYANPAYTVTEGTATVTQNGNTFTVNPSTNCTVRINFAAKPKYTVTLNAGPGTCAASVTETSAGAGVDLPTPTIDCGEWSFAGWAEESVANQTTTAPTTLFEAGDNYKPAEDCTLYAVYTKTETSQGGGTTTITSDLSFSNTTQRTSYSTSQQVWTQNGITLTNDKASSTSNVGDYSDPARFYKSSSITVTAPGNITQIEFNCVSGYVISITGASTSGTTVTVTLDGTNNTYTVNSLSAQVRLNSLSVTYTTSGGGSTTYYHSTPDCGGTPEQPTYTITISNDIQNGTIVADKSSAAEGETVKLTVNPEAGYKLDAITVTKATSGIVEVENKTFTMPASNVTVSATFTEIPKYTVSFSTGTGNSTQADISETVGGAGITLPDGPTPDCSEEGWEFFAWSTTNVTEQTTIAPSSLLYATHTYAPKTNTTLHAVYSKTESDGSGGTTATVTLTNDEIDAAYVGNGDNQTTSYGNYSITSASGEWGGLIVIGSQEDTKYIQISSDNTNRHLASPTFSNNITNITIKGRHNATKTRNIYICSSNETAKPTSGDLGVGSIATSGVSNQYTDWTDVSIQISGNHTKFYVYADGGLQIHSIIVTTGGSTTTTYYHSNPCDDSEPITPTWGKVTINHSSIQVVCGSKTLLNAADPNGPATISFSGTDLVNPVTVTASEGFLVSTDKTDPEKYAQSVIIYPNSTGSNIGKITQNVHVIADATAKNESYTGTITLTGADITGEKQTIDVTAAVTCTQYTITWSVSGDTEMIEPTTFYAGDEWDLPENPDFDCNGREFVGWTTSEIIGETPNAPAYLYKSKGNFPEINEDKTFYAVFATSSGNDSDNATVSVSINDYAETNSWTDAKQYNTINISSHITATATGGTNTGKYYENGKNWRLYQTESPTLTFNAQDGYNILSITIVYTVSNTGILTFNGSNIASGTPCEINATSAIFGVGNTGGATNGQVRITSISVTYSGGGGGYSGYATNCNPCDNSNFTISESNFTISKDSTLNLGALIQTENQSTIIYTCNTPNGTITADGLFSATESGTYTVTIHQDSDDQDHCAVNKTITIKVVGEIVTLKWSVNGATNTYLSPGTVEKNTPIGTLPVPKTGCDDKQFMGWTTTSTVNNDGSDIEYIKATTTPTENTTYYAVFASKGTQNSDDLEEIFNESFDNINGQGGNDEQWNSTDNNKVGAGTKAIDSLITNHSWNITKGYEAHQCVKMGASSAQGIITTPAINQLDGNAVLTFRAGAWDNGEEKLDIIVEVSGGATISPSAFTLKKGQFDTYTANITGGSSETKITIKAKEATKNRFFIDDIRIAAGAVSFEDYTTRCGTYTVTYHGFGGYSTVCGENPAKKVVEAGSIFTIATCTPDTDPQGLGRTFAGTWNDGKNTYNPGDSFTVESDITLYAQWTLNTTGNITLPTNVDDLANTDIVVNGGNTLTLAEGTTTINSLTLKGGLQADSTYAMPIINVPNNATLVRKDSKIHLDLTVNNQSYYPFAVPFEVANTSENVNYLDTTLKKYANDNKGYGKFYEILEYNGALRAENGVNSAKNWVHVGRHDAKKPSYLVPGKGYAISAVPAAGKNTVTIRISMSVDNKWLANGEQFQIDTITRNAVEVVAHKGDAATEHPRHAGWNFVANPYLSNFAGSEASNEGGSFINGEIIINQGDYSYGGENVPYVTIPTYNFAHYYQVKLSEATLSPAYSFFIQVGTDGTMIFETAGRQQAPASIAARNAEERPVKMDVDITLSDNHSSDQTGIIISDRYSDAYEIGRDLEKLFGSAYNLSVYTLMADNTPLAFQALAIRSNMQVIPVGYRAPEQGEYTFALNTNTSSIDLLNEQYEQLVLVDYQTGELTNLLIADYTFYSERVQSDSRFALYAVPRQNAPTDLPNALGSGSDTQKVLHNGHLYILHNGSVYNGNGQIVK